MNHKLSSQLRIAICGSAGVGKTSLSNALAQELGNPCIREEMRDYLEDTSVDLTTLPASEVGRILIELWRNRVEKEQNIPASVADNSSLDFAVYALYYGCVDKENAQILLEETIAHIATYDAIFVLPWGAIPYVTDGIRPANRYLQLRYQLILESLLRNHANPDKVYHLPSHITELNDRREWALSIIHSSINSLQPQEPAPPLQDKLELTGKRIVVARARPGLSLIATRLRELNAEVIEAPSISIQQLDDNSNLDRHLLVLERYDAMVFGCAPGVSSTLERLKTLGIKTPWNAIAIGDLANQALQRAGILSRLATLGSCHEAIAAHADFLEEKKLLLITSEEGRPNLHKELLDARATVETAIAYRSPVNFEDLQPLLSSIDLVVLPSSSAARLLLTHPSGAALRHTPMVAMGELTESVARQYGATQVIRSPHDDVDSIIHCIGAQALKLQAIVTHVPG